MGKCPTLIIFLASSLLLLLQTLEVVHAAMCFGSSLNGNYAQNRRNLFSTLADKVVNNGGFYNASLGQNANRVYALGLCARGYEPKACSSCVEKLTGDTQTNCLNRIDSFVWGSDDEDRISCFVRSSNHSTMGNLQLSPPVIGSSPNHIDPSKNMTLFIQQWESTVNRTLEAATKADTSSVQKYYSAVEAAFTEFPNVYMLMQCTPDITSEDCKRCLGSCLTYFREQFRGRVGGMVSFPSCFFRWDLYPFHSAFDNVTRVPAPPRPQDQEEGRSITEKKGKSIWYRGFVAIVLVLTFINLLVFIGFYKVNARRKISYSSLNVGSADYSDSEGQFMLRFDLCMIVMATNDFSSENKLGQGGFGTVYKGILLNGQEIAVKRLNRGSEEGGTEFKNEVSLLTRLLDVIKSSSYFIILEESYII